MATPAVVLVLPCAPLAKPYSYTWPFARPAIAGQYVQIPLGNRIVLGVVWDTVGAPPAKGALKDVLRVFDELPPLPATLRTFLTWMADYTISPLGAVLKLSLSVPTAFDDPPKRGKTLSFPWPEGRSSPTTLSPTQQDAATVLTSSLGQFSPLVLDGVTGAGKTEVYSEAIAACLAQGQQAVVLLPEIALSAGMLERFRQRFGEGVTLWHSGLTPATRRETWKAIARGDVPLVIGARSALFLPYQSLGLVVVDEEHDSSYKQEDGVHYHARDMAVVRAREADCPVILVSATPALETITNIKHGRYTAVHLPDRHGSAVLPAVTLVDMRREVLPSGEWLSPTARQAITATLARDQQVLLFLNRRGYAPLTLCRSCGHRFECPNCSAWLVQHKQKKRLQCHHCGYHAPPPAQCPACKGEDTLTPCGPGVERIAEEAALAFPSAQLAVLSSDTMESPQDAAQLIEQVQQKQLSILVGTQVMAKGHHFPALTLVVVLDADVGLSGGDIRAAERTWQLLHQVAGRSGRGEWKGQVLLQTYIPDHPVMQTLAHHDRNGFLKTQLAERQATGFPPFGRLAALIIAAPDARRAEQTTQALARAMPLAKGLEVLGPAPAPLAYLKGQHRWRFLLKARKDFPIQRAIRDWLGAIKPESGVKIQVDIDPYSFL
jgi:primosomal protein N' (replication factor Y) (superfamily II helicase)